MPIISVIVPVYKAESYLPACIDSILSQTFRDFELFLVDDGSPDNCGAICEEYARKDSRIRVIHQENRGQAAARNHALKIASGDWICFVDSDDLIHPQLLQLLYETAVEAGAGISMCPMAESPELPGDFWQEPDRAKEVLDMNEATLVQLYDREEYPSWVACAKLIRREYILQYPFHQGRVYEDNEAVCHWMHQTDRLVRLKASMYFYRTNPGSTTQQGFTLKKLDYLWALESIIRFYDSIGYEQMKQRFALRYGWELVNCGNGLRYDLKQPEQIRTIEKNARRFLRAQNIRLPLELREAMLDVLHPKLIRYYWPVKGALATLRKEGIPGLVKKINRRDSQ